MKDRKVITIDGLAGSGKSTLAKALAKELNFVYFSTGILYRSFAYIALKDGVSFDDSSSLLECFSQHSIRLLAEDVNNSFVEIDGQRVTSELFATNISEGASIVGTHKEVRKALLPYQVNAYEGENIVTEGRDLGTVVFPDAELKFFIVVDEDTRVLRRLNQQYKINADTLEQVTAILSDKMSESQLAQIKLDIRKEVQERDRRDSERDICPTEPAKDAIIINNNAKTLTQVIKNMYDSAADRGLV